MPSPFEALPQEVQTAIDRFFETRESGLLVLGALGGDVGALEAEGAPDEETSLRKRIAMFERQLLGHLDLAARQHEEIDAYGPEYALQLRGEVVSTLIALRELWRCIPELRS